MAKGKITGGNVYKFRRTNNDQFPKKSRYLKNGGISSKLTLYQLTESLKRVKITRPMTITVITPTTIAGVLPF